MNRFLREERSIVTDIPGTTRDTIEEGVSLRGISLKLTDTAGIRSTGDPVERLGVERSKAAFDGADLSRGNRCFTYRGEKYIAYTTIDKDDDLKEDGVSTYTTRQRARLVIVKDKGGFKVSLDGENQDIIFEAPLQGEEFTDIALAPPVSAQGDCAVVAYGDKVIIAAGVQGLGLSVFKME